MKLKNRSRRHLGEFFPTCKRCSLEDFHNYKMAMGLYNVKKPIAQLSGCHELHTTDGESVLKRTAIDDVVYSTLTGIRINRGHYIKHCGKADVRTIEYIQPKMAGTSNDKIL